MTSEIARLERKIDGLSRLIKDLKKPLWVKSTVITKVTGWDKEGMRTARENGYVDYKVKDGYWYDLNSVNEHFLIK